MKIFVKVVSILLHIAYVGLRKIAAVVSKPNIKDPIIIYRTISQEVTLCFVWDN
jgi:hypothetical protein